MQFRSLIVAGAGLLACLGGCATVAVYEPAASVEISLSGPRAELQRAAKVYCEAARGKGLSVGEASLRGLAESMFGSGAPADPYWVRIGADSRPSAQVVRALRTDAAEMASGLATLNAQAAALLRADQPTKDDVAQFEVVLIHARQARDSLALAAGKLMPRLDNPITVADELRDLDRALTRAQSLADDLAAARMSDPPKAEPLVARAMSPRV